MDQINNKKLKIEASENALANLSIHNTSFHESSPLSLLPNDLLILIFHDYFFQYPLFWTRLSTDEDQSEEEQNQEEEEEEEDQSQVEEEEEERPQNNNNTRSIPKQHSHIIFDHSSSSSSSEEEPPESRIVGTGTVEFDLQDYEDFLQKQEEGGFSSSEDSELHSDRTNAIRSWKSTSEKQFTLEDTLTFAKYLLKLSELSKKMFALFRHNSVWEAVCVKIMDSDAHLRHSVFLGSQSQALIADAYWFSIFPIVMLQTFQERQSQNFHHFPELVMLIYSRLRCPGNNIPLSLARDIFFLPAPSESQDSDSE